MRGKLVILFLVGWLVLGGICAAGLVAFAFPRSRQVEIGRLEAFPPADQPYEIWEPVHAYVVNNGSEVIVIDPHIQTPNSFTANWNEKERRYIDPLTGAQYDLYGRVSRGPATIDLPRYPVVIQDGRVMVRLLGIGGEAVVYERPDSGRDGSD
jgi:hypothetical protein